MNMYDTGMIVNLTISAWSGHKLDKAKTATVTSEANADSDAARVNKHLVSKDALAGITRASNALRQYFYRATLPWGDNGDRLLSAVGFLDFTQEIPGRASRAFDGRGLALGLAGKVARCLPQLVRAAGDLIGGQCHGAHQPVEIGA